MSVIDENGSGGDSASRRNIRWRLAMLAVGLITLVVVGKATGLSDHLQAERIRAWMEWAGPWGVLLFIALFAFGEFLHVPGMVFVAAAILLYGRMVGGAVGLAGAIIAVTFSFVLVRAVGGRALGEIDRPLLKKLLSQIDRRPIRAIILMRLVFWMLPPLNYALALSNVRLRDYVIGSTLGLIPPITVAAIFFEWLFTAV